MATLNDIEPLIVWGHYQQPLSSVRQNHRCGGQPCSRCYGPRSQAFSPQMLGVAAYLYYVANTVIEAPPQSGNIL
jgi:hypothetical protein